MTLNRTSTMKESIRATGKTGLSRRRLLQSVGAAGLTLLFSSVGLPGPGERAASAQFDWAHWPTDVDSYLRVNGDGSVTLLTGKVEYGQGIRTGFAQLAAEELSIPFESVEVIMGQTDQAPWDIGTLGSLSTRMTGLRIRQAAATMRVWLFELGSEALGREPAALELGGGRFAVRDAAGSENSITYAELAAGKSVSRELDPSVPLKDPSTFEIIGQSIPRVDVPAKVTGEMRYGIDAAVEGMVYGKIIRPPAFGAALQAIDFAAAEAMPGVVGVFRDGDFAGLAAERLDQAEAALAMVQATWTEPETANTSESIYDFLLATADAGQPAGEGEGGEARATPSGEEETGDVLAGVANPLRLTFRAPYINHTPIEPKTALVRVEPDRVDVWTSTQSPFVVRDEVAALLGREPESVVVMPQMSGGAFGSRNYAAAELEAARLAAAFQRPVKVIWTREEEFRFGRFRPAMVVDVSAGLDGDGGMAGWQYDLYSASHFLEVPYDAFGAGADHGADLREVYDVSPARTTWYQTHAPLPPFFWRCNGGTMNALAREVMLDALAERAGRDPVSFRRQLLADNPRMLAVMETAVAKSGWEPGVGSTERGFGLALTFLYDSYVAEVAQVEVDETSGEIVVRHVDVAIDCGLVVNPGAVRSQIEGSVVMSTSATLREAITFANGRVTNPSFAEYGLITMREAPTVDVVIVEDKQQPMASAGEVAVAPVAGAIANAVYDAVGVRLTEMPFTPERVLAGLRGL